MFEQVLMYEQVLMQSEGLSHFTVLTVTRIRLNAVIVMYLL